MTIHSMTSKDTFSQSLHELEQHEMFQRRHIGPSSSEQDKMLKTLNLDSLESLIDEAVP